MAHNPARPLSPHLSIYKWGPHMLVSILHRATGTALAIGGGVIFAWWLTAAAMSPAAYNIFYHWVVQADPASLHASTQRLANILATPLQVLAPLLCSYVAAGGHLVLAGILERQADELKEAYAPWLPLEVADAEDGWILMTARR